MQKFSIKQFDTVVRGILIALTMLLIILSTLLFFELRKLHREELFNVRHPFSGIPKHQGRSGNIQDISNIQPWMTFDYLNKFFRIPPSYLSDTLHIQDSRYPRFSLSHYAKSQRKDPSLILKRVQGAIESYLINASSTQ